MIDFEKAKELLKKAINERDTIADIMELFINLVYQCGRDDVKAEDTMMNAHRWENRE